MQETKVVLSTKREC